MPVGAGTAPARRLAVRKTYKLFIGGKFPRGESGRTYVVTSAGGDFLGNATLASRKDLRDAVVAARAAQPRWAGATPYLRGQILYRVAELLEGRRDQFIAEVAGVRPGLPVPEALAAEAAAEVDAAIDRWVWYAGWTDKVAQVASCDNPVAGPWLSVSTPEPTGVVGVIAPADSALLGLVTVVANAVATGNTAVVVAARRHPLPAVTLCEVLATSDLPAGVVNLLTGDAAELGPWLADHLDVDGLDLAGAEPGLAAELEATAAVNLKRVLRPAEGRPDWRADPPLGRMTRFMEVRTVWHPRGL